MKDAVGTVVACLLQMCGLLHADVFEQVEEARRGHYLVLYELAIGEKGNFSKEVPYAIDRSGEIAAESFARVAYYLELETAAGVEFAWVSFVPDLTDPALLGVPRTAKHLRQGLIQDLHIESSEGSGVRPGSFSEGNIEFWKYNYQGNDGGIIPGNEPGFGLDDRYTRNGNYGSMQIHNHQAGECIFAFNNWNKGEAMDLGIGNAPSGELDWTFRKNSHAYTHRLLQVLVRPKTAPGQMLERFYLHLDGLEDIGPIPYLQDSLLVLAGAQFRIRNIQTSGTRSRFMVESEHSHKMYGPFENREGGTVNLGGILLKLSMWQRK
jgi:hypothetical protein